MAPLITLLPFANHALEGPQSKLRSAGRPVSCVQVRIVDEDGFAGALLGRAGGRELGVC